MNKLGIGELGTIGIGILMAVIISASLFSTLLPPLGAEIHTQGLPFSASITPTHVKGGTHCVFTITIVNNGSSLGITKVDILYPGPDWSFERLVSYSPRTWKVEEYAGYAVGGLTLSGPNVLIGESITIQLNMTTPGTTSDSEQWEITAYSGDTVLGTIVLTVVVDAQPPTVTINNPSQDQYYSVSHGYIWVNVTVKDDLNITAYGVNVNINDTRFECKLIKKDDHKTYQYCFVNNTAIPDGLLRVKVTAIDKAGNLGEGEVKAYVDNTPPQLLGIRVQDQSGKDLPFVDGAFWMSGSTTGIKVNATLYDTSGTIEGYIYFNTTQKIFTNKAWTELYGVSGKKFVIIKVSVTDGAQPNPNNFTQTWYVYRDEVAPSAVNFTIEPICGGAIIRGISASDNVGISEYVVFINGTRAEVTKDTLFSEQLATVGEHKAFSGVLLLDLTDYAGKKANITLLAVDYGGNAGPSTSRVISVPEGEWYAIPLYAGWNLISLPLIPESTAIEDVLSLALNQKVTTVYAYDNATDEWLYYYAPAKVGDLANMRDGLGYWVYASEYDVLVVQGRELPPPPALPPTYYLTKGWVLAGFKSTKGMSASYYLSSLQSGTYWTYLYVWDAQSKAWQTVKVADDGDRLYPGQGFWIYMYEDQRLIPPLLMEG